MKEKGNISKWIYWFTFAVAVIAIYKILDSLQGISNFIGEFIKILMPFIIAIIIAYLFYIPSSKLEKCIRKSKILRKKARLISVFIVYFVAIIIVVFLIKSVIPTITNSIMDLTKSLPGYYKSILESYDALDNESILKQIDLHGIIDKLKQINLLEYINMSNIGQYITNAIGAVGIVFNIFVSLIFSIYLLLSRHEIKNFFIRVTRAIFSDSISKSVIEYVGKTNKILINFIYCQILDGIIVGILTSIAMVVLKIKYGVLLGMMIGILNIIPYFGAIIAIAIASVITLFTGGLEQALVMLIVTIILQQIDSNIINPYILGEGLKVNPILVIFAVTIGGAYFDFLGMFLAVPVVAILKIILEDYIDYKIKIRKNNE